MPKFDPDHLAQVTAGSWCVRRPGVVEGFAFDSRLIGTGQCFVALANEARDGHDFVKNAMGKGASCALVDRLLDIDFPQLVVADTLNAMGSIAADLRAGFPGRVIGITGSCGKTSTKEMLRLLLDEGSTHATAGNWNNRIGVPMTLFDLDAAKHAFAVIEAGINQPGEMALLGQMIQADLSVLTNIGPAHLELLGSLNGIAEEKSKLAQLAKAESPIILPIGAMQYPAYAAMSDRCIAVRFSDDSAVKGLGEIVDCRIQPSEGGRHHQLQIDGQSYEVRSSSTGIAQNAALAIVAASRLGIQPDLLSERIRLWEPEQTRGRVVSANGAYYYIDCYNANPASMCDALDAFRRSAPPRLARCYVLGAMNELGAAAESMHCSVGQTLNLRRQDRVVFVGPEALTAAYYEGALQGGNHPDQMTCVLNCKEAESTVAESTGALFLKGSRSYRLETLLPEPIR